MTRSVYFRAFVIRAASTADAASLIRISHALTDVFYDELKLALKSREHFSDLELALYLRLKKLLKQNTVKFHRIVRFM